MAGTIHATSDVRARITSRVELMPDDFVQMVDALIEELTVLPAQRRLEKVKLVHDGGAWVPFVTYRKPKSLRVK